MFFLFPILRSSRLYYILINRSKERIQEIGILSSLLRVDIGERFLQYFIISNEPQEHLF